MLKTLIITLAFASQSLAAETEATTDTCKILGDLAETIMDRRQEGVALSRLMTITDEDFIKSIILLAYDQPRYSSPEYQRDASRDFRNAIETGCYQANQ